MKLLRRAKKDDLNAIYELALHGGHGLTTLPKNKKLLSQRLQWACASFEDNITLPMHEYYLFVLEDATTKKIIGVSAIEAAIGFDAPFYSYKLSKRTRICHSAGIRADYKLLCLVNDHQGRSELCTLFLEPKYRVNSNGLLLSRGRFLFMADFPQRFDTNVIAELRGVTDEAGNSPLWDNLGRHFFHMTYTKADELTLSTNKQFIADLMPRNPVYISLLTPEAQAVIGKPQPSTVPAMTILLREGFRYNEYVDIFDGGPIIDAPVNQVQTIAASRQLILSKISDEVCSPRFLIANTQLDFRATIANAIYNEKKGECVISKKTAALLKIELGESLRLAPLLLEARLGTKESKA
jgi:arginine N-succinyltransferase